MNQIKDLPIEIKQNILDYTNYYKMLYQKKFDITVCQLMDVFEILKEDFDLFDDIFTSNLSTIDFYKKEPHSHFMFMTVCWTINHNIFKKMFQTIDTM